MGPACLSDRDHSCQGPYVCINRNIDNHSVSLAFDFELDVRPSHLRNVGVPCLLFTGDPRTAQQRRIPGGFKPMPKRESSIVSLKLHECTCTK